MFYEAELKLIKARARLRSMLREKINGGHLDQGTELELINLLNRLDMDDHKSRNTVHAIIERQNLEAKQSFFEGDTK